MPTEQQLKAAFDNAKEHLPPVQDGQEDYMLHYVISGYSFYFHFVLSKFAFWTRYKLQNVTANADTEEEIVWLHGLIKKAFNIKPKPKGTITAFEKLDLGRS